MNRVSHTPQCTVAARAVRATPTRLRAVFPAPTPERSEDIPHFVQHSPAGLLKLNQRMVNVIVMGALIGIGECQLAGKC